MARARPRWAAPALLAGVLLMHGWVLSSWSARDLRREATAPALQVRQIALEAPVQPEPLAPVAQDPRADAPREAPESARVSAAPSIRQSAEASPLRSAQPSPQELPQEATVAIDAPAAPPSPPPAPALPVAEGEPVPTYATQPPPAATLRYAMRRGAIQGHAVLDWRPDGAHYTLELRGHAAGGEVLGWSSRGSFDDAGLAPERFVVRRRGRDILAANLQRGGAGAPNEAAGRITYSGPSHQWPLQPGAQDRLSWMLQLAAVFEARPTLAQESRPIVMWVVGARGEYEPWRFEVRSTPDSSGPAPAVHLLREPRRPYDTRAEVWLDPARQHLPVRLRLVAPPAADVLELELEPTPGP